MQHSKKCEVLHVIKKILQEIKIEISKHPTYGKKPAYYQEKKYKELVEFLLDCEKISEDEVLVKIGQIDLSLTYYRAFRAIMKKLGYIEYIKEGDSKIIKTTSKLFESINPNKKTKDEWNDLIMKNEDYLKRYIRDLVVGSQECAIQSVITEKKIKISLKELYNQELMEFVDYAVENYEKVREYLQQLFDDIYFEVLSEYNTKSLILFDFPEMVINKMELNEINSNYINKIVEFDANIIYASKILSSKKKSVFQCNNCGNMEEVYYGDIFDVRKKIICKKCQNSVMVELEDKAKYTDFQELIVQSIHYSAEKQREQIVLYEDSEGIFGGDVRIIGYVKVMKNNKKNASELIIHALDIQPITPQLKLTQADIEKIEKVAKHPKVVDILSNELIPEIKGYETIKKAIFLQQIKGVKKGNKRGDSHILLITDPGIGKSVMLRKIAELPGNIYGSVTTASGVGLTAAVVREKTALGESWVIKPGLLVKANKGTACIDELTVNKDLQSFILEAMESQTIHISKGGINTKLSAECAILAACNPRWGKFDPNVSIAEQINIPAPMLSRFDIIFPIKDEVSISKDKDIARHIIEVHRKYLKQELGKGEKKKSTVNIDGVDIDDEFIIKYITYARGKKPIISEEADELLINYYVELRKSSIHVTARQLEAAIRLAEAHAKAKLKDVVEEEDAREAINIITEALKEIAYDPESGTIDLGKITGESKKDREKMKEIYSIIMKFSEESGEIGTLVMYEDIVEEAKKKGMDENTVKNTLKKLIRRGDIDEPRVGKYRII